MEVNITMDKMAGEAQQDNMIEQIQRRTYRGTAVGIYDMKGKMITNLRVYLYKSINGEQMKLYLQNKFNWDEIEQSSIAWNELAQVLKKYSEFKKSKIVQMI